jgi:hypothetical protein
MIDKYQGCEHSYVTMNYQRTLQTVSFGAGGNRFRVVQLAILDKSHREIWNCIQSLGEIYKSIKYITKAVNSLTIKINFSV